MKGIVFKNKAMKYLTQSELLKVLFELNLKISVQKLIANRKAKKIPNPDVISTRPYPVKYFVKTVKKICWIFSKRWGVFITEQMIEEAIDNVIRKRLYKF